MKNQHIILAVCISILTSCNNQSEKKVQMELPTKINESASCYAYSEGNNKVLMHITIVDNMATGDLLYEYAEKDKNTGKINGEMRGDTLYADYTFMSEGVNSVREVAFLKKGDALNEGYGDVEEQSGKMVFKNKNAIEFETNRSLTKTDCTIDEHGSLLSFGYIWSSIKNSSVQLSESAVLLKPIELKDKDKKPAYLIFSDDKSKAELYMPTATNSVMLTRKGQEGNSAWVNDEFELIIWKGYVLRKNKVAIFGGS